MRTGFWRYTLCLALLLGARGSASGAASSPSNEFLREATAAAEQIGLGGDQSAARREIAIALSKFDGAAAQAAAAGISRPSDAARALAAVCVSLAGKDPGKAQQAVATGARLLQRIAEPERRKEEERLFLGEVAVLGERAVGTVTEIPVRESQEIIVTSLALTKPAEALRLLNLWQPPGTRSDAVLAALAPRLAPLDGEQAAVLAASIASPARRELVLWQVAEERPAPEAVVLTSRLLDPVVRAGILASAARRGAAGDPGAQAAEAGIEVGAVSAKAEVAVDLALRDEPAAGEMARGLPELARAWALNRIAVALAASKPERAEAYLREAGDDPEAVRLAAAGMAPTDLDRALRLARGLPEGEPREAALAAVVAALAPTDPTRAASLAGEVEEGTWRQVAVEAAARQLARTNPDAATSLLGLIADSDQVLPIRARTAVEVARRDPALATRLLATLPATFYRSEAAFDAAEAYLATPGSPGVAYKLASIGLDPGLAGRWLLPQVARNANESVSDLADRIQTPYWRALGLVDAGRISVRLPAARPVPTRERMIRPIMEWEGI